MLPMLDYAYARALIVISLVSTACVCVYGVGLVIGHLKRVYRGPGPSGASTADPRDLDLENGQPTDRSQDHSTSSLGRHQFCEFNHAYVTDCTSHLK